MKVLLVNPPIYDFFCAYDFWLKPYGIISVAGYLRHIADFTLFDFLDRQHPFMKNNPDCASNEWKQGSFYRQRTAKPLIFKDIKRKYYRFGLPRNLFRKFLKNSAAYDYAMIQTTMTYWYPGIVEVIKEIKEHLPKTKIILGGNYATLCPEHALSIGADILVKGLDLSPLEKEFNTQINTSDPALWELYKDIEVGVTKLTDGCPFKCSYCSVPQFIGKFKKRNFRTAAKEIALLKSKNATDIAFYDDSLLYKADDVLLSFIEKFQKDFSGLNFHTPNALNARFITPKVAKKMVDFGFKTFHLGFESSSEKWQKNTGAKIFRREFAHAVNNLISAGADPQNIIAYQILGHPDHHLQQLKDSMKFVHDLGIKGMLADFSPIPHTKDGDKCSQLVDMSEPLNHNKTVFPIRLLGFEKSNEYKDLQRKLNRDIAK